MTAPQTPDREQEIRVRAEAAERRGRYAAAIRCAGVYDWHKLGDAAIAVADEELNCLRADRDAAVAAAARRALEDFASRLTARAASMGAEYFRVDQVAEAARRIAAEEHGPAVASPAREQAFREADDATCEACGESPCTCYGDVIAQPETELQGGAR